MFDFLVFLFLSTLEGNISKIKADTNLKLFCTISQIYINIHYWNNFKKNILENIAAGVYGLECYKTQELYFEVEMAKWNVGNTNNNIPESVCSKPCPMGQIKNFEVSVNSNLQYNLLWDQREHQYVNWCSSMLSSSLLSSINIDLQHSLI